MSPDPWNAHSRNQAGAFQSRSFSGVWWAAWSSLYFWIISRSILATTLGLIFYVAPLTAWFQRLFASWLAAGLARLTAGRLTFLFADRADEATQASLVKSEIDPTSTVLVTPRKLAPEFLDAVNPQLVVLFAGTSTRNQPSADLLAALSAVTFLQTDERGTVELVVEEEGVRMRTGK